eukprot:1139809-Pelagomonas_calceolata.AAC.4
MSPVAMTTVTVLANANHVHLNSGLSIGLKDRQPHCWANRARNVEPCMLFAHNVSPSNEEMSRQRNEQCKRIHLLGKNGLRTPSPTATIRDPD